MPQLTNLLILAAGLGFAPPAAAGATPAPQGPQQERKEQEPQEKTALYDESAKGAEQIAAALARARKENRRVLIQWGANWCGWCNLLGDLLEKNGALRRKLMYEYDVVHVDVGRFDKHMDLVDKYGAAALRDEGIPYLTVLDADGKVLASQETGVLEQKVEGKPGHDPEKVLAFLTLHQAKYLQAEKLLAAGLAEAKKREKRLLVIFGAPW